MKSYKRVKRLVDLLVAVFLLVILIVIPIIPLTCLFIIIDNPGSIFYCQERIGMDGRSFKLFKFRSMYAGSDKKLEENINSGKVNPLSFKGAATDRLTRVGKIIRKTSIDELPQLINVLKGEMSIIGPRPIQQFEIDSYLEVAGVEGNELMNHRHSVLPGLLCYWQVTKGKDTMCFTDRMKLDYRYVQNMSIKEDFKIFVKGILIILKFGNQ